MSASEEVTYICNHVQLDCLHMIKKFIPKQEFDTLNKIEISKSAIFHNLEIFQKLNFNQKVFPVLKANAYGHGLIELAQILKSKKFEYVCVDSYYEYQKIKNIINCKTLIIGYTKPKNYVFFNFKKIAVTIYDIQSLKALSKINSKINIHLKIDTGMNRQGVQIDKIKNFLHELKKYSNIKLEGVMTHLADADNQNDNSYTNKQIEKFTIALDLIKSNGFKNIKYIHIANSAGSLKINDNRFNTIRLGLGLYGYDPISENDQCYAKIKNLKPCLQFKSTIVQAKLIEKLAKISYNLTFQAQENMRIGIIPAGYYDGIDRNLSNIGFFSYNSQNLRILGKVCMNISICDITNTDLQENNEITIISNDKNSINSVANIAKLCNTIPYVITTKLAESTKRIIVA